MMQQSNSILDFARLVGAPRFGAPCQGRGDPGLQSRRQVVLAGRPGAGKGTHGPALAAMLGVPLIGVGEALRDEVTRATTLGSMIGEVMANGGLLDDAIVESVVARRVAEPACAVGFVLDGFPRTVRQAEALRSMLEPGSILEVIEIEIGESEALERLTKRFVCSACGEAAAAMEGRTLCHCGGEFSRRHDDHESAIVHRLEQYRRHTEPMLGWFDDAGTRIVVNGGATPEEVRAALQQTVPRCANLADRRETLPRRNGSPHVDT